MWRYKEQAVLAGKTIQLRNVSHSYGRRGGTEQDVLRDVALEVEGGEFVAIHGRSGSGKSTLLHIIGGILPLSQGEVFVGESDLFRLGDRELSALRNRTIGFIFQNYHLAPALTTVENVMVPALLAGQSKAQARRRALETLGEVGLADKATARPAALSGGQMQRVAVARALVNDPEILLADEPTGNLDEHTGADVLALLARYHLTRKLTVIMATHDASVRQHATRRLHLHEGQLESVAPPRDNTVTGAPTAESGDNPPSPDSAHHAQDTP